MGRNYWSKCSIIGSLHTTLQRNKRFSSICYLVWRYNFLSSLVKYLQCHFFKNHIHFEYNSVVVRPSGIYMVYDTSYHLNKSRTEGRFIDEVIDFNKYFNTCLIWNAVSTAEITGKFIAQCVVYWINYPADTLYNTIQLCITFYTTSAKKGNLFLIFWILRCLFILVSALF